MTIDQLNALQLQARREFFANTCSSEVWIEQMAQEYQWQSLQQIQQKAEACFAVLTQCDWLQAFEGHPQIGDVNSLRAKYASTKALAGSEQQGVNTANEEVLIELAELNRVYLDKFGFIFIVFASGKSALEMLNLLKGRVHNTKEQEIANGSEQQIKITQLRLQNALTE